MATLESIYKPVISKKSQVLFKIPKFAKIDKMAIRMLQKYSILTIFLICYRIVDCIRIGKMALNILIKYSIII